MEQVLELAAVLPVESKPGCPAFAPGWASSMSGPSSRHHRRG